MLTHTKTGTLALNTPDGALAMVKATFGYEPAESMVLIALVPNPQTTGGFDSGLVRLDLPDEGLDAETADYASSLINQKTSEAVLVVYSRDRTQETLALMEEALSGSGVTLLADWLVSKGQILSHRLDVCERISELETSEAARVHLEAESVTPDDQLAEYQRPQAQGEHMGEILDRAEAGSDPQKVMDQWRQVLTGKVAPWAVHSDAQLAATLLQATRDSALRDGLLALAYGNEVIATAFAEGNPSPSHRRALKAAMLGTTPIPPLWERVDALDEALKALAVYTTGTESSELLSLMGWVWFARGSSTRANTFLTAATIGAQPQGFAATMLDHINDAGLAVWAHCPQTAWKPQSPSQLR